MSPTDGIDDPSESLTERSAVRDYYDAASGSSDKEWTVPNREIWKLTYVHIILHTSAVSGNRQVTVQVRDDEDRMLIDTTAGALQADNQVNHYAFIQAVPHESSFVNGEIVVPIASDIIIQPKCKLRVFDEIAVDPVGDNMTVSFQIKVERV